MSGLPLHLIQRGNNRSACFHADADFEIYLYHLKELSNKFDCAIHAYVLMTNHVHLLLTPERGDGASLLMKHLGQRYVQYFNRKYQRSGTLWEGRFRSSIVQERGYLLRCYHYIERNPVRAGIVRHPQDYQWSSFRANAGWAVSQLITPHGEYLALARSEERRVAIYRGLFRAEVDARDLEEIRSAINGGYVWGDVRFRADVATMLGRSVEMGTPGRPKKQNRGQTTFFPADR